MHVPKSGGASIHEAMHRAIRPRTHVSGFDRSLFGAFQAFDTLSPEVREYVRVEPEEFDPGADLVSGHFALHTLRTIYPQARLITCLREPMTRLLSQWVFWRGVAEADFARWGEHGRYQRSASDSLGRFLTNPEVASWTDNAAVRMLLWPNPLIPGNEFIRKDDDETLVGQAFEALGAFFHVDILENPDLEREMSAWIGTPLELRRARETSYVAPNLRARLCDELNRDAIESIHTRTRLDAKLWRAVAALHFAERQVQTLREGTFAQAIMKCADLLWPPESADDRGGREESDLRSLRQAQSNRAA
jgi:hypothetical protein